MYDFEQGQPRPSLPPPASIPPPPSAADPEPPAPPLPTKTPRPPEQTKHRNIVTLLGAGFTPDGRRFLLLERLTEGTLGTFDALSSKEEMRGPSAYR